MKHNKSNLAQELISSNLALPKDLNDLVEKYANKHHQSKQDFVVYALSQQIENEMDIELAEAGLVAHEESGERAISHEEMKHELGMAD